MKFRHLFVFRFQQIESRWGYSGSSDKIRFIVDTRIFVVGFGLYGSIHGPSEYDVTIQLLHTGSGRILGSNEITFNSDGSNSSFRVMFKVRNKDFKNYFIKKKFKLYYCKTNRYRLHEYCDLGCKYSPQILFKTFLRSRGKMIG